MAVEQSKKWVVGNIIVIYERIPYVSSVSVGLWVPVGSRYEKDEENGYSHFLEHMFFKWAKKYKTPKAVAEAVDKFWGEFNAFTWKEYAWYYIKSASRNLEEW